MEAAGRTGIFWPRSEDTDVPILVCLLGGLRLLKAGRSLRVRPGGKTEGLLLHLAIRQGRPISRALLLERLWPESDIVLAAQALSSLIHSLSRALSDAIAGAAPVLHLDGGYRLNREAGVGVDTDYFEAYAAEGERQTAAGEVSGAAVSYGRAVNLYAGDLVTCGDAYAVVERERLRARYLGVLARVADYHYGRQQYSDCLDFALTLLKTDPGREDAHRLVMRCYVRRGERAQALRQFQLCVRLLRTEFDAAPEPATVALFDQIRLNLASL